MSSFQDILSECGVTDATLTLRERCALDEDGFVVLKDLLATRQLAALRDAFERDAPATGTTTGTRRMDGLIDGDPLYAIAYTHPRVVAATHHVLARPFRVFVFNGRDPRPGFGLQGLHADWQPRVAGQPPAVATALWLLDDFTAHNGATRVVPGSHTRLGPVPKKLAAPAAHHANERILSARAGSAVFFNGHLWHSGTRNDGHATRRVLQCQFVANDAARAPEPRQDLDQLPETARRLLGM